MDNLNSYGKMLFRLMQKTLFNLPSLAVFSGMLLTVIGSSWTSNRRQLKAAGLFLAWTLMSLPVIFFPKSLSLTQLYVGTGLGLIGLLTLAIKHFSQLKWGALLAATLVGLLVFSAKQTFTSLIGNHDVFFITIQDDLNYHDQQALLAYVEQAAAGQPYRLKSFSIPYYQEEGWQYLHQFHVPDHSDIGARTIFVVIEQAVDPFWIKKWTEDLGPTQLIEERWFGKLRVQRRAISDGIPQ